ncbi:MAG: PBSX family phage terminase large subunit [Ketobacter sp.]|nr:PBSX family phage terminase large subunit [Ketobacter sp.]
MSILEANVCRAFEPFLKPSRYKAAYGGRGGAKSWFFASQVILQCYEKPTRVVCIREVQNSLKESVRQLLIDIIQTYNLGNWFKVMDAEIRGDNGSLIIFKGMQSYNAQSIKSLEGYDIAWIEEAQTLSNLSLRLLRPTIRAEGSELWFSWNPRHKSDAVDKFFRGPHCPDNALVVQVCWKDNPWFPAVLQMEKDQDYAASPEMAEHIWGGNYEIITEGAIYAKYLLDLEKQGRICSVPYNPEEPVYTAWDLGIFDSTAVWFVQVIGAEIRIIDYYEVRNQSLLDTARLIKDKPYLYAEHYMPHDTGTREMSSAKTRKRHLEDIGFRPIRVGSRLPIQDGINAVHNMLPKCVFDAEKTEDGLNCLRNYRVELDELRDTPKTKPLHDWSSHGADAFRELAVQLYDTQANKQRRHIHRDIVDYDPYETAYSTGSYN